MKHGNRNHSVNEIGGSTFRNSILGEKAIVSIQLKELNGLTKFIVARSRRSFQRKDNADFVACY